MQHISRVCLHKYLTERTLGARDRLLLLHGATRRDDEITIIVNFLAIIFLTI